MLLPGMDGTGRLFNLLIAALGNEIRARVISYPPDRRLSYDALLERVEKVLPSAEPFVILAESFSGPIAIRLAARRPRHLLGVILCTSFAVSPIPRWLWSLGARQWLRRLVPQAMFRPAVPPHILRGLALDWQTPRAMVQETAAAIRSVSPAVLAGRLREVLDVDVTEALRSCEVPVLYLAGSRDRIIGRRGLAEIRRVRPAVESIELPGPHFLLQARPEAAARVITEYLRRWSAGPA